MPNPKCASCSLDRNRGKLLKCMHSVCVQCLPKQITFGNGLICPSCSETTPPPPGGVTYLQALPDSTVEYDILSATGGSSQIEFNMNCDECIEDEKAVSRCVECKMNYCNDHAQAHSKSRTTYLHKLETLTDTLSAEVAKRSACENCPLHRHHPLHSFCSQCSQLLCQQCELVHPSGHNERVSPVSDAAAQAKEALIGTFITGTDGERSNLDQAFDGAVVAIQDLHTQTETVSAEVSEYFDGLVKIIRGREKEVLSNLDQLRSTKLLPLEAQRSRLGDTITGSSTAKSYLTSRQSDANFLKMRPWLEEIAHNEAVRLKEDGEPCTSAKLGFTPNTDTDMLDVARQLGDVADVAVPFSQTSLLPPTHVCVEVSSQETGDQSITDSFNPAKCHPGITLTNSNCTATVTGDTRDQCVVGATTYATGQHDIRIRMDSGADLDFVLIGMTNQPDPPLDEDSHSPGLSAWAAWCAMHIIPSSEEWQDGGDVGQEWMPGDILHLHLDCQQHTLSASHERTGKTHTIHDVTGDQRLFIGLYNSGGTVSII